MEIQWVELGDRANDGKGCKLMDALDLINEMSHAAIDANAGRFVDWGKAGKVGLLIPDGLVLTQEINKIAQLDCLLLDIEKRNKPSDVDQFPIAYMSLSQWWVIATYEILRTLKQRVLSIPKKHRKANWTDKCAQAFIELEALRTQLTKREFAKFAKVESDPINNAPETVKDLILRQQYKHGQTILGDDLRLRDEDFSLGWLVFFSESGETKRIYRRDLSEHVLVALLTMYPWPQKDFRFEDD